MAELCKRVDSTTLCVRFALHESAVSAVAALQRRGMAASLVYNQRAYDGDGGRGWCIAEQGAASAVAAHLEEAIRAGQTLPERLARAQASRPKVLEICADGSVEERAASADARALFRQLMTSLEKAVFVGKGDQGVVRELLGGLDWTMHMTVNQAMAMQAGSELTIDPSILRASKAGAPVMGAGGRWSLGRWLRALLSGRAVVKDGGRGVELSRKDGHGTLLAHNAMTSEKPPGQSGVAGLDLQAGESMRV